MRLDFCALCGERDAAALEHHHFIPQALGGSDNESNMFTVCGTCHGKIHDIPRPLRLGELVKAGVAKAQERTAAEYRQIAEQSTRRAERATEQAKEAEKAQRAQWRISRPRLISSNDRPKPPKESIPRPPLAVVAPSGSLGRLCTLNDIRSKQMQKDKRFRIIEDWALASNGVQWVLQRRSGPNSWEAVSFIRTSKDILARCMGQKGTPHQVAERLLDGLPDWFEAWHEQFDPSGYLPAAPPEKTVMTPLGRPPSSLEDLKAA